MMRLSARDAFTFGVVVFAVLVTAGAGFCLFDTDGDAHDGTGLDLCTAMVAVTIGAVVFIALGIVGAPAEARAWAATPVVLPIPDPPPWP